MKFTLLVLCKAVYDFGKRPLHPHWGSTPLFLYWVIQMKIFLMQAQFTLAKLSLLMALSCRTNLRDGEFSCWKLCSLKGMPASIVRWVVWKAFHVNSVSSLAFEVMSFIELDMFNSPLLYLQWASSFWVWGVLFVLFWCAFLVFSGFWVFCLGFLNR